MIWKLTTFTPLINKIAISNDKCIPIWYFRSNWPEVFFKKAAAKISQNSLENVCNEVLYLVTKNITTLQMLSCEFGEIFENNHWDHSFIAYRVRNVSCFGKFCLRTKRMMPFLPPSEMPSWKYSDPVNSIPDENI